jgi:hypothetical protein
MVLCEEQCRLAEAVVVAVQREFVAKTAHAQGIRDKSGDGDLAVLASALAACQAEERRAVEALEAHKRDHGCGTVK